MSRRHHGRSRHARGRSDELPRTQAQTEPRATDAAERPPMPFAASPAPVSRPVRPRPPIDPRPADLVEERPQAAPAPGPQPAQPPQATNGHAEPAHDAERVGCTAPQLRRFIKSRPYVPMHELRRRFGINGAEDDVTPLAIDAGSVYVGLPERECRLLGELVRGGEVGYELSLDPRTPIVVGVYPMRPVPRA